MIPTHSSWTDAGVIKPSVVTSLGHVTCDVTRRRSVDSRRRYLVQTARSSVTLGLD